MDVVGDLLARDRRSRSPALVTPEGGERTSRDLITNAHKAANVLRYLGAREGTQIAVDPTPAVHATVAFLGAARLGAPVRFDPSAGVDAGDRVVVIPVGDELSTTPSPGTSLAVFGGAPERSETTHWEQELWSENPAAPPATVSKGDPVIRAGAGEVTHRRLLEAADAVAATYEIGSGTRVVVRTSFGDPRAVAAGVVAPLAHDGVTVLAGDSAGTEPRGDLAVVDDADTSAPEPERVVLSTLAALED
jgi:hypothetical protein